MSEEMRNIMNNFNFNISESTINRLYNYMKNYECAIITAFRKKLTNCRTDEESDKKINIRNNKNRNIYLKSALLYLGYQVTSVKGTYIENYLQSNAIEVKEDSFFVVNVNNDSKFKENIFMLGELMCQDSVLIIENGGQNNYLVGTNDSTFPGYGNKYNLGKFKPALEREFMTKISGRPFVFESYEELQINSKRIVKGFANQVIELLK